MSKFNDDLIQSLTEAVAHAKGQGTATTNGSVPPPSIGKAEALTFNRAANHTQCRKAKRGPVGRPA